MSKQRKSHRSDAVPNPAKSPRTASVLWVPLVLTLGIFLLSFLPRVQGNPILTRSFWGAVLVLLVWEGSLFLRLRGESFRPSLTGILRKNHWVQMLVQIALFAYWGWYWRPIYDMAGLIAAQLAFGYAVDMLLAWSRRETYRIGFGPFPIIFSINIFLWFKDDWFYLQFLMIAVAFLGKALLRWEREGRRKHIFNPSAFTLTLFSIVLIATNTTDLTWGPELASTLTLAPRMYAFLFLAGVMLMYIFSITLIAGAAAVVLFGLSALYMALTGVPYFVDSEIPAAVFLGLHLLITDPSTSPRTPLGRTVFGGVYGLGVFVSYALLEAMGVPSFYDKLLVVPILNLTIGGIDRAVHSIQSKGILTRWRLDWFPARANVAWIAVWIVFFGAMASMGKADGRHTGDSLPFWEQACEEGRRKACEGLLDVEYSYCLDNSGWACNEVGRHLAEGLIGDPDPELSRGYFNRACEARFQPGCLNLLEPESLLRAPPRALDLRLLLREGGQNLMDMPEQDLYARACDHDWTFACERAS